MNTERTQRVTTSSIPDKAAPHSQAASSYESPEIHHQGQLGELVRGASWKGVDSVGEIDPDNAYPS